MQINERQREGIAQARLRGAYRGRKRSVTTQQVAELRRRALAGESRTLLAKDFGISRETVYQYLRSVVGQPRARLDQASGAVPSASRDDMLSFTSP